MFVSVSKKKEKRVRNICKGYIRESNSLYASPLFFIKKKDGKLRPIQDYWKLNKQTIHNNYPLPLIKTILEQLQG